MNKRELIKALFKNPTIKALYESGHFHASDINRVILMEASESGARRARNEAIKELSPVKQKEELEKRLNIYDKAEKWTDLVPLHPAAAKKPDESFEQWYGEVRPRILDSMQEKIKKIEAIIVAAQAGDTNKDGFHDDEATRQQQQQASNDVIDTLNADEAKIDQDIEEEKQGSAGEEEYKTGEPSESSVDPAVIAELEKLLNKADQKLLPLVNKYPKFKELLAVAYVKALKEKPEKTATTSETGTTTPSPKPASVQPPEDEATVAMGESINRALSGIFLIENTDGGESTPASTEGGTEDIETATPTGQPVDVNEVPNMLKVLKELFNSENLAINVDEIWKLSQKKESEQGKKPETIDTEDVSPPEPAEFQEAWIENLQTFFGKNPNKSSFMRRLLLRDQAKMLYEAIATLEAIKKGTGKTGEEGKEQTALTGMNQDDEKEKIANKPTEPTVQSEGVFNLDDPGDAEQVAKKKAEQDAGEEERKKEIQTAQQQSMNTAVQNYQPETNEEGEVKLPSKTKRIIKQDLQAMVDLLRDVKKVLKSYSDNATKTSVDPRFDGSKLKARLDELLTQVQEDIFELHSNLKVPSKPEGEENQLEEALQGIFLEEADPERKEKIALVREVYDEAKRQYISVLSVSMEGKEWDKSKASAGQILEILKREDFISLFPTGMSTSSGKIVTVSQANDVMKGLIQEFIEIVRDIILISKTDYVSPSDLGRAGRQLVFISKEIAEYFKIASKFPPEEIKKAKVNEAAKPENQAITPVPQEKLDARDGDTASGPTIDPAGDQTMGSAVADGDAAPASDTQVEIETSEQKFQRFSEENQLIGELAKIISNEEWRNDDEKLQALMAAQSYMIEYAQHQVKNNESLSNQQKDDIKKYLKDNIIGDTRKEGTIKESEGDKSTSRIDDTDPNKEPHQGEYGLSFIERLGEEERTILRSKPGLVNKLAQFIDENFKNLIKDYSDNEYLDKINKPVETKMQDLPIKFFGDRKQIQDFWTLAAKTLGELSLKKSLQENDYSLPEPKSYGKLDTFQDATLKSVFGLDNLDNEDINNLYREMGNLFEYIVESNAPKEEIRYNDGSTETSPVMDDMQQYRMGYVSRVWRDALFKKSKDINFRKQFAPFMRFIQKFRKKNKSWYEEDDYGMKEIRGEFERIMKEKGMLDYIMKSSHNPAPNDPATYGESLEKALKPIIEKMLKEHYNH
jgi:hypothetical protein